MPNQISKPNVPQWLLDEQQLNGFWDGSLLVDTDPQPESQPENSQPENSQSQPESNQDSNQDQPKSKSESGQDSNQDSNQDSQSKPESGQDKLQEIVEAFSALVAKNQSQPEDNKGEPESEPKGNKGEPEDEPKGNKDEPEDSRQKVLEDTMRQLIIQQSNVPQALVKLLPNDLGQLTEYLGSPEYRKLANALSAPEPTKESAKNQPEVEPETDKDKSKATPKTFDEITDDMLAEFSKAFT